MKRYLTWIVAADLFFAAGSLHAATTVEMGVPGLSADHTVSSIRYDFYRAFDDKQENEYTGNLAINKRPSARQGSWTAITVNQDVIFQTFLLPTRKDFNKTVVSTLAQIEETLSRRQTGRTLLSTNDLTRDEF